MMVAASNKKYFTHWCSVGNRYNDYSNGSAPPQRAPESVPQTQKPDKYVNYAQLGIGASSFGVGSAQAVGGTVEGLAGAVAIPESLGSSLLLVGSGLLDMGLGASAANDGILLMKTAFDGVQRDSTFGAIGQHVAGDAGFYGGKCYKKGVRTVWA